MGHGEEHDERGIQKKRAASKPLSLPPPKRAHVDTSSSSNSTDQKETTNPSSKKTSATTTDTSPDASGSVDPAYGEARGDTSTDKALDTSDDLGSSQQDLLAHDPGTCKDTSQLGKDTETGMILPSLLGFIQEILNQYPDDGQILKELIQNADDAGAQTIKFLLDERTDAFPRTKLSHPGLAQFQGPALYVYNDGIFTDDDWTGLRMMHKSIKSKDPIKTGRFGLGFKSIFHITDLPMVLFGNNIGFIDPHQLYLPEKTSAYPWHITNDTEEMRRCRDQFEPLFLDIFGSTSMQEDQYFPHTLFRFPLRSKPSELSQKLCSTEHIDELINSLIVDDGQYLLFLKHMTRIEVYKHSEGNPEPILMHRASIVNSHMSEVVQERGRFLEQLKAGHFWTGEPVSSIQKIGIGIETHLNMGKVEERNHEWIVFHWCGTNGLSMVEDLARLEQVLPCVGIAMPLSISANGYYSPSRGRVFVSLPLPLDGTEDTGLPFHINGSFVLEQNRRHLKWPTTDQDIKKISDLSLRWNHLLISTLVPWVVYEFLNNILQRCAGSEKFMSEQEVYAAMPNESQVDDKWKEVVRQMYPKLLHKPCLFSPNSGKQAWLAPGESYIISKKISQSQSEILKNILLKEGFPLVLPPDHVLGAISSYCDTSLEEITVGQVKDALLKYQAKENIPLATRTELLHYFWEEGDVDDLLGLALIPLSNNQFESFASLCEDVIYVTTQEHPHTLLPSLEHMLLQKDLDEASHKIFMEISKTGKTQVKMLDPMLMIALLQDLSMDSREERIRFGTGIYTEDWVEGIWKYIQRHECVTVALTRLSHLYLLPVNANELCKMISGRKMLVKEEGSSVPDSVLEALVILGITVISDLPKYVILEADFLHQCTLAGVMEVLSVHERNSESGLAKKMISLWRDREELHQSFVQFLSSGIAQLQSRHRDLSRQLPIFLTKEGSGSCQREVVALSQVSVSASPIDLPCLYPQQVIDIDTPATCNLLETLGVQTFHRSAISHVFKHVLLPQYTSAGLPVAQLSSITLYYLDNFQSLSNQDEGLKDCMKRTKCIPNADSQMSYVRDFFDPSEDLLAGLLSESFFPPKGYCNPHQLEALRNIGFRGLESLRQEELLAIAKSVSNAPAKAQSFLNLLREMCENDLLTGSSEFWLEMSEIPCIPINLVKPKDYPPSLPWFGETAEDIQTGSKVRHISKSRIVGAVYSLADTSVKLLEKLHPRLPKDHLQSLVSQLKLVVQCYLPREKPQYIPLIDELYDEIFQYDSLAILGELKGQSLYKWIWSGNEFKSLDRMLLNNGFDIEFEPHLSVLPPEMVKHRDALQVCGMADRIDPNKILEWIAEANQDGQIRTLVDVQKDLTLSVHIIETMFEIYSPDILVPIENDNPLQLKFCHASYCIRGIYCHEKSDGFSYDADETTYVHHSVPKYICDALHIRSETSHNAGTEALEVEECGQSEPLTKRLSSIIDGYTDGMAFVLEMIQNADDAGALEVKLIYDMRSNNKFCTKLLDPGMKAWQGPAFWVFNDAKFSERDFANIAKLNGATKQESDLVGRFGLGFNSVYNITDVPSFLSGEQMVIFDPHLIYLNDALRRKTSPGIKFKVTNNKVKLFNDQFAPWNGVCGCNLNEESEAYFNGTLFRLPIRGYSESCQSEISRTMYSNDSTKDLFKMLKDQAHNLLLFTQSVTKFSVSIIKSSSVILPEEDLLFTVQKTPISYLKKHGVNFEVLETQQEEFRKETSFLKAANNCLSPTLHSSYSMAIKVIATEKWQEYLNSEDLAAMDSTDQQWLVTHYSEKKHLQPGFPLPVSGIAIQMECHDLGLCVKPLLENGHRPCGSFFTFLPLPQKCKLSFHVNGSFCLDSSRRHIVTKCDHDRVSAAGDWNKRLMDNIVCTNIYLALKQLELLLPQGTDLFPLLPVEIEHEALGSLTEHFWKKVFLHPEDLQIFKCLGRWVTLEKSLFLGEELKADEAIKSATLKVMEHHLKEAEFSVVDIPPDIETVMRKIDPEFMKKNTLTAERFFTEVYLPHLDKFLIPTEDRNRLLFYGMTLGSPIIDGAISHTQCIPVCGDAFHFLLPSELIHPTGRVAQLYDLNDRRFPLLSGLDEVQISLLLSKLCSLGMTKDEIRLEDLSERAEAIAQTEKSMREEKLKGFMSYLGWMQDKCTLADADIGNTLCQIRYIPSEGPPEESKMQWKGDPSRDYCASELLYHENALAVCLQYPHPSKSLGITQGVANLLGMKTTIELGDIEEQLKKLSNQTHAPRSRFERDVIWSSMDYLDTLSKSEENGEELRKMTSSHPILYLDTEDTFVFSSQCSTDLNFKASPYFFQFTGGMFDSLHRTLHIKEKIQAEDYLNVLEQMKNESGEDPVDKYHVALIIKILEELQKIISTQNIPLQKLRELGEIYMLNTKCVLYPARKLAYNDCPWMKNILPDLLTHPKINYEVSKHLGAKDIRTKMLSQVSQSLGRPFGQKERLEDRIKSVLNAYPFGGQILMEFAQNADDAGATELHFILDKQTHKTNTLFAEIWSHMQGPSLCVYNNASFSDDDLEGIIAFGRGSKNNNPAKIGHFGVGLNCIYHLTDVQLIRIQMENQTEKLLALDPTCQFVPGVTPSEPGMIYEELDILRECYPDVFSGFHEETYKGGTFFRFPLRQITMGKSLSSTCSNVTDISNLIQDLKNDAPQGLLFLTSLREIHFTTIDEKGTYSTEIIRANMTEQAQVDMKLFRQNLKVATAKLESCHHNLELIPKLSIAYTVNIKGMNKSQTWNVVQTCGTDGPLNDDIIQIYRKGRLPFLPVGGAALMNITEGMNAVRSAFQEQKGKVFASLPMPLETNLPLHINGHFALDHESRQHLWEGNGDEFKKEWNKFLCTNVIAPSYVMCLQRSKESLASCVNPVKFERDRYWELFPLVLETKNCYEADITERVCSMLAKMNLLPGIAGLKETPKWLSVEGESLGYFMDDNEDSTLSIALMCQMDIIKCPVKVKNVFNHHLNMQVVNPSSVIAVLSKRPTDSVQFLQSYDISQLKSILNYCQKDSDFASKLEGLPLLMTASGKITTFSRHHPVFKSNDTHLVKPQSDEFLHPDLLEIFTDVESEVFKEFTLKDFTEHFALGYPCLVSSEPISWEKKRISPQTLVQVWAFIMSENDGLPSMDNICICRVESCGGTIVLYPLRLLFTLITGSFPGSGLFGLYPIRHFYQRLLNESQKVSQWLNERRLLASSEYPASIARAFVYYKKQGDNPDTYVAMKLLDYFIQKKKDHHLPRRAISSIKELEIFPTTRGELASGTGTVYVIPKDIPKANMDTWKESQAFTFLRGDEHNKELYSWLTFHQMSTESIYTEFIIPQIELGLIDTGYWEHMLHVAALIKDKPSLIGDIKGHKIVRSEKGYNLAEDLYSPHVEIFNIMEERKFPMLPLHLSWEDIRDYIDFLKQIGLINEITPDIAMTYARILSQETGGELKKAVKALFDHINGMSDVRQAMSILEKIKDIEFIPRFCRAKKTHICPPSTRMERVALNGSYASNHCDLVWSVAPVITNWFDQAKWKDSDHLGILPMPDSTIVIQHLKCISNHQRSNPSRVYEQSEQVKEVLSKCFLFLESNIDKNRDLITKELGNYPCIYMQEKHTLVQPGFVFINGDDEKEIQPYLWRVPYFMTKFPQVLELIGCEQTPTAKQYQRVLQEIQNDTKDGQLDKMTHHLAEKAILSLFESEKVEIDLSAPLYLLSEDGALLSSSSLLMNNNPSLRQRITDDDVKLLFRPHAPIPFFHLLEKIPESHRPRNLTSQYKEVISKCILTSHTVQFVDQVEKKLHSHTFTEGFHRLARHIKLHGTVHKPLKAQDFEELSKQMSSTLENVELIPVKHIATIVTDTSGRECSEAKEEILYLEQERSKLYVKDDICENEAATDHTWLWYLVAEMLDQLTDGLFKGDRQKLMVILSVVEDDIEKMLDTMGVRV